jgi:hypothetical protein
MGRYLGITAGTWSLIFAACQAAAVIFAVAFGTYQLRSISRQNRSNSLDRMLQEWRANLPVHREVLYRMPLDSGTVAERSLALARRIAIARSSKRKKAWNDLHEILEAARETVHMLNDLGTFVEQGVVNQVDFFSHFHVRIIELVYVLEPYILLVSTVRGSRWGFRLIRLRIAAELYHRASKVHSHLTLVVRGQIAVTGRNTPHRLRLSELRLRRHLIPTRYETASREDGDMETLSRMLEAMCDPALTPEALRNVLNV